MSDQFAAMRNPSTQRLSEPHQIVTLKNTGNQTHILMDRGNVPHALNPGDTQQLDMPVSDIERLRFLARTDRGVYDTGPLDRIGKPFPPHPVVVLECGTISGEPDKLVEPDSKELFTNLVAREAALAERENKVNAQLTAMANEMAALKNQIARK
jgi:hypothetical protein